MIKASKLFLVPSLSMFLIIIPWGFLLTLLILCVWYSRNQADIHAYFRGQEYRMNEISQVELEKDKLM